MNEETNPEQPSSQEINSHDASNRDVTGQSTVTQLRIPKKALIAIAFLFLAAALYAFIPNEHQVTGQNTAEQQLPPVKEPAPLQEAVEVSEQESQTPQNKPPLSGTNDHIINQDITPFKITNTSAELDELGGFQTERYSATYDSDKMTTQVHVFKFANKDEVDAAVNTEFFETKDLGAVDYLGNHVIAFLSEDNHRIVTWPSATSLVYVDTTIPQYAALEVVRAYLEKYPSNLETNRCIDTDSKDRFNKGTVNRLAIGSTITNWTDTCLKDHQPYKDGQYKPGNGVTEKDGLLEGECDKDKMKPGHIQEYICPRGCVDGKCKV